MSRLAAALALACSLTACGYTFTDRGGSWIGGARTVRLQVVGNDSWRQRFELPLTRQLERQLPVVAGITPLGAGDADSVLRVTLTEVSNRSLVGAGVTREVEDRAVFRPVLEGGLDLAVDVELLDTASGAILRRVRLFDRAEYRIAVGETEASALEESAFDLARKIALSLAEPF